MNKKNFEERYEISDAVPIDPTSKTVPAEAFAQALEEFMENRFRGVARVRLENLSAKSVLVSAEYTAYFFKMLLTYVYGRVFINIDISSNNRGLVMFITPEGELPLTDSERRFLIKTARNAGMEVYLTGGGFKLMLSFSDASVHHIYAISVGDGKRVVLGKLCEIFFCGAVTSRVGRSKEEK